MSQEESIRIATPGDAPAIGRVHVVCLHETYTGLMPPEWLAVRTVEERTAQWKSVLDGPAACGTIAIFIAECEGEICGFASCGWQRTEFLKESGFVGEVSAIYVLQRFQGRGIGRALMRSLASTLSENSIPAAALWCLRDNTPARRFYEKIGGEFLIEQQGTAAHANQIEVAYGWRSLGCLMAPANEGSK